MVSGDDGAGAITIVAARSNSGGVGSAALAAEVVSSVAIARAMACRPGKE